MEHAPCDVVFVQAGKLNGVDEIAIVTDRSPYNDPLKVELADAIAAAAGARIRFVFSVSPSAPESSVEAIRDYHTELDDRCSVPVTGTVVRDAGIDDLLEELSAADVVTLSVDTHRFRPDLVFSSDSDRIATRLDGLVLLVHSNRSRRTTFLEPIVRFLFR